MPIDDSFLGPQDVTAPAARWFPIVPSDENDLPLRPRAIFVGTGGDLVAVDAAGGVATFKTYDGQWMPMRPHRVMATGTTATNLVAVY